MCRNPQMHGASLVAAMSADIADAGDAVPKPKPFQEATTMSETTIPLAPIDPATAERTYLDARRELSQKHNAFEAASEARNVAARELAEAEKRLAEADKQLHEAHKPAKV